MQANPRIKGSGICAKRARLLVFATAAGLLFAGFGSALAEQTTEIKIPLSGDLVPAPFGYEPISGHYIAARTTPVYISPYAWAGKVRDAQIEKSRPVEVLAKVRDYDWLLVGTNGAPLGYVPLSMVSPVK